MTMIEITQEQIISKAYEWIGTPYVLGQASRSGCDCLGLIRGIASELGIEINFTISYREDQQNLEIIEPELFKYPFNESGEIVVNKIRGCLHFGIFTGKSLIHCTRLKGVHLDSNQFWLKKPFYRLSLVNLV